MNPASKTINTKLEDEILPLSLTSAVFLGVSLPCLSGSRNTSSNHVPCLPFPLRRAGTMASWFHGHPRSFLLFCLLSLRSLGFQDDYEAESRDAPGQPRRPWVRRRWSAPADLSAQPRVVPQNMTLLLSMLNTLSIPSKSSLSRTMAGFLFVNFRVVL